MNQRADGSGLCRTCGAATGTYKNKSTGRPTFYVSCRNCKDVPPSGYVRCEMGNLNQEQCKNFAKEGHKVCYAHRDTVVVAICDGCKEPFTGRGWQALCGKCYAANKSRDAAVMLAELMGTTP